MIETTMFYKDYINFLTRTKNKDFQDERIALRIWMGTIGFIAFVSFVFVVINW